VTIITSYYTSLSKCKENKNKNKNRKRIKEKEKKRRPSLPLITLAILQ